MEPSPEWLTRFKRWLDSQRWRIALWELFVGMGVWALYFSVFRLLVAFLVFLAGLPGEVSAFGRMVMAFVDVVGWFVTGLFFFLYTLRPLFHLIVAWVDSGRPGLD